MEAGQDDVEGLRAEVAALRAARTRLVLAADADRRRIERELHGGVQQNLVALAMRLQLVESALDSDPAAARALVDELSRDMQDALDEAARLAQRIHAPLLELGLAAALRATAAAAGIPAAVDVSADGTYAPEALQTVYGCWLDALADAGAGRPALTVRDSQGALVFELVRTAPSDGDLEGLRDRVEALGGTLTIHPELSGIRVCGSLPPAQ